MKNLIIIKFFPWLNEIDKLIKGLNIENIDSLKIRNGEDIINNNFYSSECKNYNKKLFAVYCDKEKTTYYELKNNYSLKADEFNFEDEEEVLSIEDQLLNIGEKANFILEIDFQNSNTNENGEKIISLIVYDLGKLNLRFYYKEQIRKASQELWREIEKIFS